MKKQEAEKEERLRLKQLVLNYEEREQEEEMKNSMLQQGASGSRSNQRARKTIWQNTGTRGGTSSGFH
jgi:hypothetical protein